LSEVAGNKVHTIDNQDLSNPEFHIDTIVAKEISLKNNGITDMFSPKNQITEPRMEDNSSSFDQTIIPRNEREIRAI
jgi:hypothetical protein